MVRAQMVVGVGVESISHRAVSHSISALKFDRFKYSADTSGDAILQQHFSGVATVNGATYTEAVRAVISGTRSRYNSFVSS